MRRRNIRCPYGDCAPPFRDQCTRDLLPKRVVWDLGARVVSREVESFYYLTADAQVTDGIIISEYYRNTNHVMLKTDGVTGDFRILLNSRMVDFSRPVVFVVNGKCASLSLETDEHLLATTTAERGDPNYQFKAAISYADLVRLAK